MKCEFCDREFTNAGGFGAHVKYCKLNPNHVVKVRSPDAGRKKGCKAWNEGLSKETDQRMMNLSLANKGRNFGTTVHSEETKKHLSRIATERGLGGYVQGSGRGKKGWYKGFFCDSSWELAYVMYCLDNNIKIERNTEKFKYEFNGETKNYIPDFICEGRYVEIKGFDSDEWQAKLMAFPYSIKVLYQDDIDFYLDYAKNKYGKKFTDLYE